MGKYHLDVYGDGGSLKKAKRFAKRHNLNVKFHGNVSFEKLIDAINDSHLDILVSNNFDTFGMTLIEAEAFGVPVFFCDKDMEEIVPKGSFIKSKNASPAEMTNTLNALFNRPEKIAEMSKTMLNHRHEILISNRIKTLEKIFSDIIKK